MKPLGRGHYGVVRRCKNIETGEEYAMKTIRKARVSRVESLLREVNILRKVSHPNIIELVDVYEDEMNLHLVSRVGAGRYGQTGLLCDTARQGAGEGCYPGGLTGLFPAHRSSPDGWEPKHTETDVCSLVSWIARQMLTEKNKHTSTHTDTHTTQ